MGILRACAECNAGFSNMTVIQGSGIDPEEIVSLSLSLISYKGKVDTGTKSGIEMGEMVSFIVCL